MNARIRARATHHDLSSAIPDKKKEKERYREKGRKGKNKRERLLENQQKGKRQTFSDSHQPFFSYRNCCGVKLISKSKNLLSAIVLDFNS